MDRRKALQTLTGSLAAAGVGVGLLSNDAHDEARSPVARRSPIVATNCGRIRGLQTGPVGAYLGIPYASSSAVNFRFMPPSRPQPWTGVRDCFDYGHPCVQINTDLAAWVDTGSASEDCLCLNVWAPHTGSTRNLPVMVWIHGGAYLSGSGGLAIYDGTHLAGQGNVVVVSVNHRLGALGYLYLGGISDQFPDSGNVGQLDLVAALRWVQENIGGFGGDPGNITVFGESGGGGKINALCSMPAAKGLFHKAIIESGSFWNDIPADEATQIAHSVLSELSIPANRLNRLQDVPPFRIVAAADKVWQRIGTNLAFRPVLDGRSIHHQFWETAPPPWNTHIPMLIGTNRDESVYLVADARNVPSNDEDLVVRLRGAQGMRKVSQEQAYALIEGYRKIGGYTSRLDLLIGIATDVFLWRDAVLQSDRKAEQTAAPIYAYRYDWRTPCFGREWSLHGAEIPMVFGNLDYIQAWDEADIPFFRAKADPTGNRFRLTATIISAWTNFARFGKPSAHSMPDWLPYDASRRATMLLDSECALRNNPHAAQRILLDHTFGRISMQT